MSKPASIRELLDWLDKPDDLDPQVVELAERVEAVLRLHKPFKVRSSADTFVERCEGCAEWSGAPSYWPCPTIRALEGQS